MLRLQKYCLLDTDQSVIHLFHIRGGRLSCSCRTHAKPNCRALLENAIFPFFLEDFQNAISEHGSLRGRNARHDICVPAFEELRIWLRDYRNDWTRLAVLLCALQSDTPTYVSMCVPSDIFERLLAYKTALAGPKGSYNDCNNYL